MPRHRLIALAAGILAIAPGCGGAPSAGDFADKAESFIEGDMAKSTQLNGLTFTEATCQPPASTAAGTEFTCTAMGSDGQQRTLTAKVLGRNALQIIKLDPGPPQPSTTTSPTTTTPAAPPTTAAPSAAPTTAAPAPAPAPATTAAPAPPPTTAAPG
jgi:hypothetical protein